MIITTTDLITGKSFEMLGLVQGNIVRTKHLGKAIAAGLRSLGGGEIKIYTELLNEARDIAISRMKDNAAALGADAVVCVRLTTCSVMDGSSEVTAYGTAVKFV